MDPASTICDVRITSKKELLKRDPDLFGFVR